MSSILLPRALSAAPSVAQINWDAPVLDGAVCVVSENVLYTRKNKIVQSPTKTLRYAGRSFFNCDFGYVPELDSPTISMLAVSALDAKLAQYGTYVGFGYYTSSTDQQLCYTTNWSTTSPLYKGMFRQGSSSSSPAGSLELSVPWRGVYGFRVKPSSFENIIVSASGSISIDNGGYHGSYSVNSKKSLKASGVTLLVGYNTFVPVSQIKEFSSAPYKIFKGSPRFIEHQSASSYTHPTLSLATLVAAGGNQYQPRVTYTF